MHTAGPGQLSTPARSTRRAFFARAAALASGSLALAALPAARGIAAASDIVDCDMSVERDGHPYKGFASIREGSGGQCTTHAARRFDTVAPPPGVNWTGGARLWYGRAAAAGWVVTPELDAACTGALVIWDNWDGVSEQRLFNGHVAFVEDVTPDGVLVSEMNWGSSCAGQPRWRTSMWGRVAYAHFTLDALARRGPHRFVGYVYPVRADVEYGTE